MSAEAPDTEILRARDLRGLRADQIDALFDEWHAADIADAFSQLKNDEEKEVFLRHVSSDHAIDLTEHLYPRDTELVLRQFNAEGQRVILEEMEDDVRTDLLQELDSAHRERLLALLSQAEKERTRDLLQYPENSAGGRMTAAAWIKEHLTTREALDALRRKQEHFSFMSRIFVVDDRRRILGRVRLRDLVFAPPDQRVREVMEVDDISITAMADQEEAAQMIMRYDLAALPVTDEQGVLLGVITHDDAMEIVEEEVTEDIEKSAAIRPAVTDDLYINIPILHHWRRRVPWVVGLAFVGILSGNVIFQFEEVLSQLFALAIYMPMVVAAGGNTGGQAATMVVRAMSLGEIEPSQALRIAWKELRVGLLIGLTLATAIGIQVLLFLPGADELPAGLTTWHVALTVATSLVVQVTSSTLLGSLLPLGARAIRMDPAVVSAPGITSTVDISGMIIYFVTAKLMLGL